MLRANQRLILLLLASGASAWLASPASAQRVARIDRALVLEVMPGATRFEGPGGDPPVLTAFATDPSGDEGLLGYVFLTSDLPPEQFGYSGPIEALVGMRTDGTLTGVRVVDYRESYMRSMGDFLRRPGFQEQFAGKHIGDPFQLWGDVEGISRVSISVRALSRGVRDASRRVANAYGLAPDLEALGGEDVDPVGLSWFELRQVGVVQRFEVTEPGEGSAGIALALIENDRLGRYLLGEPLYERAVQSAERRGGGDHLVLYAIDGSRLRLFRQEGWSVAQGGDTTEIAARQVLSLGLPSGGIVQGEATLVGLMLVPVSVDIAAPFRFVYDLGDFGVHAVDYESRQARLVQAEAEAAARIAEEVAARGTEVADREAEVGRVDPSPEPDPEGAAGAAPADDSASEPAEVPQAAPEDEPLNFTLTQDETLLERTLANTSWGRVATIVLVLSLAGAAFAVKGAAIQWASLLTTLVVLGFVDGGFLSISHVTGAIWAGAGVFVRDLPLLLMVAFTVVTTLVWGRVFCGFLCPFGALQDVIDRVVPERWKRVVPDALHDRGIKAKYVVLAIVVVPALLGSRASVYQYVEPFGTVFFLSPSVLLWSIAGTILAACVVVPRFYCRYVCPLGAFLALLSFVSLRRIERVPQCDHCKVCEQRCPTGAIRGPTIDFPECVRCNACEVALRDRVGVCRHDMEEVRTRLVNIERISRTVESPDA